MKKSNFLSLDYLLKTPPIYLEVEQTQYPKKMTFYSNFFVIGFLFSFVTAYAGEPLPSECDSPVGMGLHSESLIQKISTAHPEIKTSRDDYSIEVVYLPEKPNFFSPEEFLQSYEYELKKILSFIRKEGTKPPKLTAVTLKEAEKYFKSYLLNNLTKEEIDKGVLDRILSPEFIDIQETPLETKMNKEDQIKEAFRSNRLKVLFFNALNVNLKSTENVLNSDKWKIDFNEQRGLIVLETLLMDPKDLYEGFKKYGQTGLSDKLRDNPETELEYKTVVDEVFSNKYFGIPRETKQRTQHWLSCDFGRFHQKLVKSIFEAAKTLMKKTKPGDTFVIPGNTPYLIGRALTFLSSNSPHHLNYRIIVEFPFSGSPNTNRDLNPDKPVELKNRVTEERLNHLKGRLKKAGLSYTNNNLLNHNTYFIDVVGSGSGIAYIAEEILRDFKNHKKSYPNLKVISLNNINIYEEGNHNYLISNTNPDETGHTVFHFPSIKNTHFKMDAEVVYVPEHLLLDLQEGHPYRIVPGYNPSFWQDDSNLIDQPKTKEVETLLEYFDTNIKALLDEDLRHEEKGSSSPLSKDPRKNWVGSSPKESPDTPDDYTEDDWK